MTGRKRSIWLAAAGLLWLNSATTHAGAQGVTQWPREIVASTGTLTVYQPQVDTLEGNVLRGRAAFSFKATGQAEPKFGALWLTATINTDRSNRTYTAQDVQVEQVRFPELADDVQKAWSEAIAADVNSSGLTGSLDTLMTDLDVRKNEQKTAEEIKNDPPEIIVTKQDAVLVPLDGEPVLRPIEKTQLQRVANTPFLMVQDGASKKFYLNAGSLWYSAGAVEGPWAVDSKVPPQIKALVSAEALAEAGVKDSDTKPVQIIVTKKPAELISFSGEPKFIPFTGNDLLYAENTESDIFLDVKTQTYYTLLSGRWFQTKSLTTPNWSFIRADALPAGFKNIPPNSPKTEVRASIAGTDEAEEATLDASIPQTAAVKLGPAPDVSVAYDGQPQFQPVEGTDLQYAVNTPDPVFKEGTVYYACEDGIWYQSTSPNGPWSVSTTAPNQIDKLPPANPHYNTKYVYVYQTTPTVVYVGYTPAYMGTYIWGPTVVYGTGWRYRPWIGPTYYYPYQSTWGFHVRYNPWTGGWGFGLSYSTGGFGFSFAWGSGWYGGPYWGGRPGWWGAGGYWHGYNNGYNNGYWHGRLDAHYRGRPYLRPTPYNKYRNDSIHNRPANRPGNRPSTLPAGRFPNGNNIYDRPGVRDRVAQTSTRPTTRPGGPSTLPSTRPAPGTPATRPGTGGASTRPATRPAVRPSTKPDNVYADQNGNVFRKDNKAGWQQYDKGKWNPADNNAVNKPAQPGRPAQPTTRPAQPTTRPTPTQPATRPAQPQTRPATPSTRPAPSVPGRGTVQGDAAARDRAQTRINQYPQATRPPTQSRPAQQTRPQGGRARWGPRQRLGAPDRQIDFTGRDSWGLGTDRYVNARQETRRSSKEPGAACDILIRPRSDVVDD